MEISKNKIPLLFYLRNKLSFWNYLTFTKLSRTWSRDWKGRLKWKKTIEIGKSRLGTLNWVKMIKSTRHLLQFEGTDFSNSRTVIGNHSYEASKHLTTPSLNEPWQSGSDCGVSAQIEFLLLAFTLIYLLYFTAK